MQPRATVEKMHDIRIHPNAPHLRCAFAGEHKVVTGDHYEEGSLGVFIPAGSIVPDELAEEMWLLGRLGGKKRNRVVAKMMRGELTLGLFYGWKWRDNDGVRRESKQWNPAWVEGQDVTEELGLQ